MTIRRAASLLLLLAAGAPSVAHAQQAERDAAKEGQDAYDNGDYVLALHKFERAEEGIVLIDPPEQILVYRMHAYCLVALDRTAEAQTEFRKMLAVDPDLDLDPKLVAPKILTVFHDVRRQLEPPTARQATLYSALAPGLGQIKTKRRSAGVKFIAGTAAAVLVAVYEQTQASTAEHYASEAGPLQVSKFRKQAQRYDLQRDAAVALAAGVWIAGAWDAGHNAPKPRPTRFVVAPVIGHENGAVLLVRF